MNEPTASRKPRWRCPKCHGTEVQISLPAWFEESTDHELRHVGTDDEADVMAWWCPECNGGGAGEPEEADAEEQQS
jgi:hypothetical protein